ncbi:MAG: Na+/H+ antiporter NhaC family protein [Oscillospiraceae bacterium]|nr:Na+/H+ antiporter NhaC family protein [Oscillospiraceae bacterium]
MNRKGTWIGYTAAIAVIVILMAVAKLTVGGEFAGTIWSLFPPVVAIILALVTKETYISLFVGILAGALFVGNYAPVASLDTMLNDGFLGAIADGWNAGIFMFLVLLGIMVALINTAGGSAAFGRWAVKHVRGRVSALLFTFLLGVLIFIDDYFNCLTVGSVMRPVTDRQKISRAKLAFIIDATAAPVCMIAPVSSWAAAVSATAQDLGVNGIQLFIQAIPYNFYSLLTIVFVITLAILGVDYGPMAAAEMKALQGELGALSEENEEQKPRASVWDMLFPVITLVVFCVIGMMYVGGFWSGASFIDSFADTDASVGLPWGCIVAVLITYIYLLCRRVITFKEASACITKGFIAMVPSMLILTFALTLKNMTGLLGAADYVAGLIEGAASELFAMLPAVIFLVALGLAFASGTSWGTFGILIPIVLPVFANAPELLMIGISACLAGAVCGDHCSPISDTTIMASAGANCDHIQHVSTQLPYALSVAGISFVCYVLAGFIQNWIICLAVGAVLTIALLVIVKAVSSKKKANT